MEPPLGATEERLKVTEAAGPGSDGGTGGDNSELVRGRREAKSIKKDTNEVRHFCAGCSAVRVQFVDDEVEDVRAIRLQPTSRLLENLPLDGAHQHDVQHRVVGDQDVGWMVLHVPS